MTLLKRDQENIEKENQGMEIKHLIFDLDGTLWNTTKVSADAYNDALRKDGRCDLVITTQHIKNEFGKSLQAIADDLFPGFNRSVRDDLMHQCAVSNIHFLAETDEPMLYSDVRSTLDILVQSSKLYIVSNCETGYIEMFLKKYDLESYFTDFECLGNNGNSKADNIRLLMQRNQIPSAIYVGDTDGDYRSAVSAKIPFIFAAYGYGTVKQNCPAIHSFSELLTL